MEQTAFVACVLQMFSILLPKATSWARMLKRYFQPFPNSSPRLTVFTSVQISQLTSSTRPLLGGQRSTSAQLFGNKMILYNPLPMSGLYTLLLKPVNLQWILITICLFWKNNWNLYSDFWEQLHLYSHSRCWWQPLFGRQDQNRWHSNLHYRRFYQNYTLIRAVFKYKGSLNTSFSFFR